LERRDQEYGITLVLEEQVLRVAADDLPAQAFRLLDREHRRAGGGGVGRCRLFGEGVKGGGGGGAWLLFPFPPGGGGGGGGGGGPWALRKRAEVRQRRSVAKAGAFWHRRAGGECRLPSRMRV